MVHVWVIGLLMAAFLGGCEEGSFGSLSSRGSVASFPDLPEWRLSDLPTLTLAPDQEFFAVEAGSFMPDGRIVITEAVSRELLFFDSQGSLIQRVGGSGEGPGEYRSIALVPDWSSDTLLVFDVESQRLSFLSPSGEYLRALPMVAGAHGLSSRITVMGRMRDGRIVVQQPHPWVPSEPGLFKVPTTIHLMTSEGEPLPRTWEVAGDEEVLGGSAESPSRVRLPFLTALVIGVGPNRVFRFEGPEYVLHAHSVGVDGDARVAVPYENEVVAFEPYAAWVETRLVGIPPGAVEPTRQYYHGIYEPWLFPAVIRIVVDDSGRIWAGEREVGGTRRWMIFSPTLEPIATLRVPGNFRVLAVREGRVLGIQFDAFNRSTIEVWELVL